MQVQVAVDVDGGARTELVTLNEKRVQEAMRALHMNNEQLAKQNVSMNETVKMLAQQRDNLHNYCRSTTAFMEEMSTRIEAMESQLNHIEKEVGTQKDSINTMWQFGYGRSAPAQDELAHIGTTDLIKQNTPPSSMQRLWAEGDNDQNVQREAHNDDNFFMNLADLTSDFKPRGPIILMDNDTTTNPIEKDFDLAMRDPQTPF